MTPFPWFWTVLVVSLFAFNVPASADPYDNQLTMHEWDHANHGERLSVAQLLIVALVPRADMTQHPMTYAVLLKHCVDTAAKDKYLGHLKLSDVALSCAVDLGWR